MNSIQRAIALALAAVMPLTLSACDGGTPGHNTTGTRVNAPQTDEPRDRDPQMRITLLGFGGCPLTPLMRRRLEQAIVQLDGRAELVQIDQQSLDASDLRRGYPAPTVMVNGSDLFGMAPPTSPSMGCRMYDGPDGVPSVDDLAAQLRKAMSSNAEDEGGEG